MKKKTKKVEPKGAVPRKLKFSFDVKYVVLHPPPTEIKDCPRCGGTHKKLKPLKFGKSMVFYDRAGKATSMASHWMLCPKTKEPVIFYDRASVGETIENIVVGKAVEDIAAAEDKKFLDSVSTWTASYTTPKKGKKGKEKQKPSTMKVTATFGPATTWVYDPNAPERIVPGTKKEAAAQAKRFKAQVRKAKENTR